VPGGFDVGTVESAIGAIAGRMPLAAAAVTAYAPEYDVNATVREAAFRMIGAIVAAAGGV
jgi:hypothetical protein